MKFTNDGKTTVCGQWTSKMKTHFLISIAICSDNDIFNKKEGKRTAKERMDRGYSIVLPTKYDFSGNKPGLKEQLKEFLTVNC